MSETFDPPRRFPRLAESHTLLVRCLGPIKGEGLHLTGDLSLGGCRFVSATPFGLGAKLEIHLLFERRVMRFMGRVIREVEAEADGYAVGVEFTGMGKREKKMLESVFALEEVGRGSKAQEEPATKFEVA